MTVRATRGGARRREVPRTLAADLRDLVVDLSADGYNRTTLALIERELRRTVPSILGASVTLDTASAPDVPVVVHFASRALDPQEIGAALVLPLPGLPAPRTARITLYATQPGAFGALVPELARALQLDPRTMDPEPPLPSAPVVPRADGLQDFNVVNRALGVLLNRGHTLDTARVELGSRAEQSDLTAAAYALLASTNH